MIKRYINKTIYHPYEYENARVIGDGTNILPITLASSGYRTLQMTPEQFKEITSALYVGTRISYPDKHGELLDVWLDEKDISSSGLNCTVVPAYSNSLEYFYNDPYNDGLNDSANLVLQWVTFQDIVEVFPQWLQDVYNLFGGVDTLDLRLGYRNDDVFFVPNSTFDNILSPFDFTNALLSFPQQFLPSIVLRFRGTGNVRANVLSTPAGGSVIAVLDRSFTLQETIDAINAQDFTSLASIQSAELQRDIIQFPPETVANVTFEWDIIDDTDHTIELFYIPRFNDSIEFIGFGGGFRNFEICDGITLIDQFGNDIAKSQIEWPKMSYISTTLRQIDKTIVESEPIQLVQANIERSNDINQGLYGFTADIFDKLDSSNTDSFVPAYIWERRFVAQFRDNEPISITIDQDAVAFRLYIQVNSDDAIPKYVTCYLNGDFINGNYFAHETSTDSDLTTPVIGVANFRNGTTTPHIIATMYDYTVATIRKTMISQSYGTNETGSDRRQGGYAYYWNTKEAVNRIDILLSGLNYQILGIEVHYLKEELVLKSQDLGLKPPPPAKLEDVAPPVNPPSVPVTYFYTMDDLTDFTNVPGAWVVDSGLGNPAPSLSSEVSTAGGGNFQIEFSQPISIRKISFELFVLRGSYVIDEIRTIAYDVDGVNFTSSNDVSGFMPGTSWTLFEFNYGDVGQLHDRILVQILSVLDGSGDTFPTIYKIDNLRVEGIIP